MSEPNPLSKGFYSVPEAARLIEVGNSRRIHGWLKGYRGREISPLLVRDYAPIWQVQELSFYDLLEVRFVEFFREQGVKVSSLRAALKNAREVFETEKPLASSYIKFHGDSKDILVEEVLKPAASSSEDPKLWSLLTKQFVIYEALRNSLVEGVVFDPKTQLAQLWAPRVAKFPHVTIDPKVAYGKPIVPSRVPTQTIYETWLAEGGDFDAVADWFEIPTPEAHMAVEFEQCLDGKRKTQAA